MTDQIKIIEYDNEHAAAVADMWNRSGDSWGGYNVEKSAENVLQSEEASTHKKLLLAKIDKEVVGYCKVSVDHDDEGALYVDLLNVRPDMHGKKIGKKLMIQAVKETIDADWPRLDLHTWTGNVKAVPLYKKCGFFWEDRDDTTHLMNFIPTVVNTELTKEFFKSACWYDDSVRPIEQKPDGRKENEFDLFTYAWQKEDRTLELEFCRRGRGLRKIETEEYSISATVEDLKLVFGKRYKIRYDIINKTDKPLELNIKGEDNKNIRFDFAQKVTVDDKTTIEADFFVDKIDKAQMEWKTHPVVAAEIQLNGKKAHLKVGIKPEFPVTLTLNNPRKISTPGIKSECYLDLENHYNEEATFRCSLPETNDIKFTPETFEVTLKAKDKKSIPAAYLLHRSCCYTRDLTFEVEFNNGNTFNFIKETPINFHTHYGKYHGESKNAYVVGNGTIQMNLWKLYTNQSYAGVLNKDNGWFCFLPPKLGKPFSSEFEKKNCDKVDFTEQNNSVTMLAHYRSKEFKDILIRKYQRLFNNGMIECWYEVENCGKQKTMQEISLNDSLYMNRRNAVFFYKGEIITTKNDICNDSDYWQDKDFDENWFFSQGTEVSYGLVWPQEYNMKIADGAFCFEHNYGIMQPGEIQKTKPIISILDYFEDWHKLREFALQKEQDTKPVHNSFELSLNKGNPFVKHNFTAEVIENRRKNIIGELELTSAKNKTVNLSHCFVEEDKSRGCVFDLEAETAIDTLTLSANLTVEDFQLKKAVFPIAEGKVKQSVETVENKEVLVVDNGCISIKAAPDFAPGLFSAAYNGEEWLDTSFPTPTAKSWWSPWCGGMITFPGNMGMQAIQKEICNMEFVEKTDNHGNIWTGIRIDVEVKEKETLKGLKWSQFYLLMPGVPVILHTVEVYNGTGKFYNEMQFENETLLLADNEIKNSFFSYKDNSGKRRTLKPGFEDKEFTVKSSFAYCGKKREQMMQTYCDIEASSFFGIGVGQEYVMACLNDRFKCEDKKTVQLTPKFFIFTDKMIEDEALEDLKGIRF